MGMAVRMNVAAFKEGLRAKVDKLHAATRPAAQAGVDLPPGAIAALFAAIDVSYQGPFEAMARLGLVMVQAEAVE